MDLQLKDKRALVTGASRGLGFATARLLAEEGCQVAVNSRDEAKISAAAAQLAAETGGRVVGLAADISRQAEAAKMVARTVETLSGLDLLVCNAGGPPPGPFENFDEAAWRKAVDLTFLGNVWLIQAALPHLKKSSAASVLTITSYSVKQPIPNLTFSNSLRAATVGLTKSLALELGSQGIRFNSILPAWTETERVEELMNARAVTKGTTVDEEITKQAAESVFGRFATPEEFATAAVFLLSPAASYLTGVMLPVDGGMLKGTF